MRIDSNISMPHLVCCQWNMHTNKFFLLRDILDNIVKDYMLFMTILCQVLYI